MKLNKHTSGYTMIELVMTLAILAILITFSIGPIRSLLLRNQVKNEANLLQLDLSYARSEAINRAYPVVVKPIDDWQSWEIFVDVDDDGEQDSDEEQLRITAFGNSNLTLTDSADSALLTFTSLGSLKSAAERSLTISHSQLPDSKAIFVAAAGTVSLRTVHNE